MSFDFFDKNILFKIFGLFRCLDLRYPLQSRRWYCPLGGTCDLRSRFGLMTDCCRKWSVSSIWGYFLMLDLDGEFRLNYVQKRCLQRLNFLKSVAGVWWGAHSRCMIKLYRGLVGSVLEYGSVYYSGIARTHMLRLKRVQYPGIRIALGLMCSTPNNSLGVLSGKAPLAKRSVYLNF
jgi:hypothetical protein